VPQDAILLMALVIGLYLADSALLLHRNEGVLSTAGGERWLVDLGSRDFEVRGKHLYLPNPFFPHRPVFRLAWSFEGADAGPREDWNARRSVVRPIGPAILSMAAALFVLLPLGFFTRLGNTVLVAAILLLYTSICAALIWIWRNRSRFGLGARQYAALAFESLVCSPLALNLARKLCARVAVREDLVGAARRLQSDLDWLSTRTRLVARLDEAIESEEERSPRMARLVAQRRRLTAQ
jgi:hypothetical protein